MNSIINRLGLETLPDIAYIDLDQATIDAILHESIRIYAMSLIKDTYQPAGFYFYNLTLSSEGVQEMLAIKDLALKQIDNLGDKYNIRDYPELYNITMLTYLLGRGEGIISLDEINLESIRFTCAMIDLVHNAQLGKVKAYTHRFTIFPTKYHKPFAERIEPSEPEETQQ